MRGHTAKFLRRLAPKLGVSYRRLKRDWLETPADKRGEFRRIMGQRMGMGELMAMADEVLREHGDALGDLTA